jgi:hypothetical protein
MSGVVSAYGQRSDGIMPVCSSFYVITTPAAQKSAHGAHRALQQRKGSRSVDCSRQIRCSCTLQVLQCTTTFLSIWQVIGTAQTSDPGVNALTAQPCSSSKGARQLWVYRGAGTVHCYSRVPCIDVRAQTLLARCLGAAKRCGLLSGGLLLAYCLICLLQPILVLILIDGAARRRITGPVCRADVAEPDVTIHSQRAQVLQQAMQSDSCRSD